MQHPPATEHSLWPNLRAGLLASVLIIQFTSAIPLAPLTQARLERPEGARLLNWIAAPFATLGLPVSRAAVADALIGMTEALVETRNRALQPFEAWFHHTQTGQRWGLFLNPKRECYRLQVEVQHEPESGFELLYRAPDFDRSALGYILRERRIRGLYNSNVGHDARAAYPGVATWLANRIFSADPHATSVRVRLERVHLGEPGTALRSLGFEHVELRTRGATP